MLDDTMAACHPWAVRADRHREISALVAAFVAHVLFLTLAPRPPLEEISAAPEIADTAADTTIDIDTTPVARQNTSEAPAPIAPSPPPESASPGATRVPSPSPIALPEAEEESEEVESEKPAEPPIATAPAAPEDNPAKPAPPPAPADEYGSLPPSGGAGALGVPGLSGPLWSIPGVVPSADVPKPAPTTIGAAPVVPSDVASRVLSGTLHSRDKTLGLEVPGAGVVASSIADALRNSALTDMKGTFEVKLAGNGTVESVRFVGSSDGDASQWAAVAEAARRSLGGRALEMGPDKQPVTVIVKVESKIQYPAGTKEKYSVQPVCANEVVEQLAAAIEGAMQTGGTVRGIRDDRGQFIPYSELDEERKRRFCIPIGIRGKGDLSNIGAHTTNVVSSSFQVKRAGEQALPAEGPLPVDRNAPWLPVAEGKTRPPPPPPKKKKKPKPRRGSFAPVQINR